MKKLNYFFLVCATLLMLAFSSCNNDDEVTVNPANIDFASTSLSIDENAGEQTITINFSEAIPVAGSITVTTGGTATYTDDYTTSIDASSGSFTVEVAQGATSASFSFTATDDRVE